MSDAHYETIARNFYKRFHAREREAFEALMHDDFQFTSPYDDHIDKAAYFERCWPNGHLIKDFKIDMLAVTGRDVFIHYSALGKGGKPFHNVEIFTIEDGKVAAVQVYFGEPTTQGTLPKANAA